jgi:hypothetical protein
MLWHFSFRRRSDDAADSKRGGEKESNESMNRRQKKTMRMCFVNSRLKEVANQNVELADFLGEDVVIDGIELARFDCGDSGLDVSLDFDHFERLVRGT